MKHYKEKEVPAHTKREHVSTTCDLCSAEIDPSRHGCYEVDEVEISHRTGNSYPEGGAGDKISVDMCGHCFTSKLMPWLESEGVKIASEEWEF